MIRRYGKFFPKRSTIGGAPERLRFSDPVGFVAFNGTSVHKDANEEEKLHQAFGSRVKRSHPHMRITLSIKLR
jgi:hypothetical protein